MTYNDIAASFDREHIYIVEMDLEYCSLTHGTAPCTAVQTGDAKCFNTRPSCNDLANYDNNLATASVKTYRFCSASSPQPIGLDAIPSLESLSISASKIDVNGGLGQRSSVSMRFNDHPSSDIGVDKYLSDRTYIALERGTFWTKLRARNPNYQYREIRVLSGFLVDGAYDAANFKTRTYVIESLDVAAGKASVTGKDPLKLAMTKKAQVPEPSTGTTSGVTLIGATTIILNTGDGAQYAASGKVLIGNEVISYSGKGTDTLTGCTRGENNTVAREHSSGSTVQQCYEQTGVNVDIVVADILKNYANIPASYIDDAAWAAETALYLDENLNGIIVKPTDVSKVLKELSESAPHFLYWDEEGNKVVFYALKKPPLFATLLEEGNILKDSLSVNDKPDMRYSTIFVNCGQFDPTKNLDEESNYQLSYVRVDSDSLAKYGSNQVKKVNSRWIGITGLGAAIKIATLYGRRFSNIPREIGFKVDPRFRVSSGGASGLAQLRSINHRDITDFTGTPVDTIFQVLSEQEMPNSYQYTALEFPYGDELAGDSVEGTSLVYVPPNSVDANLASIYTTQIGAITGDIIVTFVVNNGDTVSASTTATPAMTMGDWSGATSFDITLQINTGAVICGKGGAGGSVSSGLNGGNGGLGLNLTSNLTLVNNGTIGGGGGGGAGVSDNYSSAYGGGGAGFGSNGGATTYSGVSVGSLSRNATDGTGDAGGLGGIADYTTGGTSATIRGGGGGALGSNGDSGLVFGGTPPTSAGTSGSAGAAIDLNGFTLTKTVAGTISGAEIA